MDSLEKKTIRRIGGAEMNVVPYIDVMLVLLVIFMITAPILSQGVEVDLPRANSSNIELDNREPMIVSIDKEGAYHLNLQGLDDKILDAQTLVNRVAAQLKMMQQDHEKPLVLVKGDQGVSYGHVVAAMALLKQAGVEKVGLMTDDLGSDAHV